MATVHCSCMRLLIRISFALVTAPFEQSTFSVYFRVAVQLNKCLYEIKSTLSHALTIYN